MDYLKEISAADWIYIDGEVHFQRRFYENLIKTRPDYAKRVIAENPEDEMQNNLHKLLNENIHYMKEHGGRTVHTRIRSTIKAKKEFEEVGRKVRVHLPIPKVYEQVSNVKTLNLQKWLIYAVFYSSRVLKSVQLVTNQ